MRFALSKIRDRFRRLPERIVESSIELRCAVHADRFRHAFAFPRLGLIWDGPSAHRSQQNERRNKKYPMQTVLEIIEAFISHVAVSVLVSTCISLFNGRRKKQCPNNSDQPRREERNLWSNPPQNAAVTLSSTPRKFVNRLHALVTVVPKRIRSEANSNDALLAGYCLINDHSRNGFTVRLLLRRVDAVSLRIHCQAVHSLLNREIFQLAIVIRIVHLEDRDRSTRAGDVNSLQSRIELDDVGSTRHRQECDRLVLVEIEHSHKLVSFAREEGPMVLWVKGHPVISLAASHGITPYDLIRSRIDDGKNILILQIHVNLLGEWIVLRHSRFAV